MQTKYENKKYAVQISNTRNTYQLTQHINNTLYIIETTTTAARTRGPLAKGGEKRGSFYFDRLPHHR